MTYKKLQDILIGTFILIFIGIVFYHYYTKPDCVRMSADGTLKCSCEFKTKQEWEDFKSMSKAIDANAWKSETVNGDPCSNKSPTPQSATNTVSTPKVAVAKQDTAKPHINSVYAPLVRIDYFQADELRDPEVKINFPDDTTCIISEAEQRKFTYVFDKTNGIITLTGKDNFHLYYKVYSGQQVKDLINKYGVYSAILIGTYNLNGNLNNPRYALVSMIYTNGSWTEGGGDNGYQISIYASKN